MMTKSKILLGAALAVLTVGTAHAADENLTSRHDTGEAAASARAAAVTSTTTTTITTPAPAVTTRYYYRPYDKNSDGILGPDEFTTYTFTRWDTRGLGYIDAQDWPTVVTTYRPYRDAKIENFSHWDKNGDGRLQQDEVAVMVEGTGLYADWDANHDGRIDASEYASARFHMYDINSDGTIDSAEWADVY